MTPEGKVKARVRKVIAECPARVYLFMPVQTGVGASTLDFLGCIAGHFFAVETKAGSGRMTPRQQAVRLQIEAAGGEVFLLDETPDGWQEFHDFLIRMAAIAALEHKEPTVPAVPEWAASLLSSTNEVDDEEEYYNGSGSKP